MAIDPADFIEGENLVANECRRYGWTPLKLGYHDHLPEDLSNLLARINSPTALYFRTLADRFMLNPRYVKALQVEIKDHRKSPHENLSIEGFPLLVHQEFHQFFPKVPIVQRSTGGSGDPFALITTEDVKAMPSLIIILKGLECATS